MSITTYNAAPYHDDYLVSDNDRTAKDKNYLKILFKPGVSVQARELNQIQSMLQNQIDTHGSHIFKRNTPVIDGKSYYDDNVYYADVVLTDPKLQAADVAKEIEGRVIQQSVDNADSPNDYVRARIYKVIPIVGENTYRIFYTYTGEAIDFNSPFTITKEFTPATLDGSDLTFETAFLIGDDDVKNLGTINSVGYAARIFVDAGVFYINGCFVVADATEKYILKQNEDSLVNGRLVYSVTEEQVASTDDSTLLDNAQGEPNFAAPGADRYQINLDLKFLDEDLPTNVSGNDVISGPGTNEKLIDLLTIENSKVINPARTEHSELQNTLARRTSEESGNYTVNPFILELREFLNENNNRGRYTEAQLSDLQDSPTLTKGDARNKYYIGLEQSVAYVDGYRIETTGKKDLSSDKARDKERDTATSTVYLTASLGQYIETTVAPTGVPDLRGGITYNFTNSSGVTCKIRGLELNGDKYRLYIYDIQGGSIPSDSGTTLSDDDGIFTFTADSNGFSLIDASRNSTAYKLPYNAVDSVSEIEIVERRRFNNVTAAADGSILLDAGADASFPFDFHDSYFIMSDAVVAHPNSVDIITDAITGTSTVTLGGSFSGNYTVFASVRRTIRSGFAVETQINNEESADSPSNGIYTLSKQRVVKLTGVRHGDLSDYQLIRDDRPGFVGDAKVKYIGSASAPESVDFSYTYLDGGVCACARDLANSDAFGITDPEDIPSLNGSKLTDYLDFRQSADSSETLVLDPNSTIQATVEYYLPRIDKVFVDNVGNFDVLQGEPSLNPEIPETPDNAMALYNLIVPAYTYSVKDIAPQYIDNRRYTMRDIGSLERRISNLEYYTSLSLLEREATNRQIMGDDGDRFKNGILVDSFRGHDVGNVTDPGYRAAIDTGRGILRPLWEADNLRLQTSGQSQDLLQLGRDEDEVLLQQKYASIDISVNPYELANWNGTIELSPSSDEWIETEIRPDVIINEDNNADALLGLIQESNALGTEWGSWNTVAGTGRVVGTTTESSGWTRDWRSQGWQAAARRQTFESLQVNQIREGIRTTASVETISRSLGERVIDTNIIPFIRSRKISFKGELFKPNTKLYAFFDDVDVTDYCEPTPTFNKWKDESETPVSYLNVDLDDSPFTGDYGKITTDSNGNVTGSFIIPNNSANRFRTGRRQFRLTDSKENNRQNETTSGVVTYTASGLLQSKEEVIISSREVVFNEERIEENRNINVQGNLLRTTYYDPLAQSFLIGNIETGCYVSKVDLFFRKKSENVPVSMHLVTVENGIPTQKIVPFSRVVLQPDAVNVDDEALLANEALLETTFTFESPVYLTPGVEYAMVVLSNDPAYRLWFSDVGGEDVSGLGKISKNPFAGVSFKSQNASTWTPDQNKDFKFTMYRAKYNITPKEVTFDVLADGNIDSAITQLRVQEILPAGTSISYKYKLDGTSGTSGTTILPNSDLPHETVETFVPGTTTVVATLKSTSNFISPSIDLDRISLLAIRNIVGKLKDSDGTSVIDEGSSPEEDTELSPDHGGALARYITKEVDFNNPAGQLNIYLLANRVSSDCNIRVYVRTKTGDESIEDNNFVLVEPESELPVISDGTYTELEYIKSFGELISAFQVKIVFHSNNIAAVSTVKDFRVIATTG